MLLGSAFEVHVCEVTNAISAASCLFSVVLKEGRNYAYIAFCCECLA